MKKIIRIKDFIDRFLFRFGRKIQSSNFSVVKYFFYIFICQILIYILFFTQSKKYPLEFGFVIWPSDIAIPTILTITGLIFTIIVLFAINPKKTQYGDEFIFILIDEINSLKEGEEITIISPNINIGTTTYKSLLDIFIKSITKAKKKGAIITFKSLSLKNEYLNSFTNNSESKIGDYTNFYSKGIDNDSEMLSYLYNLYDKQGVSKDDYVKTIEDLSKILRCVSISKPQTDILDKKIVGFLSNDKFYLGKYNSDRNRDKKIFVRGEIIDTPETVQMLREHFIKDL